MSESGYATDLDWRERGKLAVALGRFWAGGAGPSTHDELTGLFDDVGIDRHLEDDSGSKRDRVETAVRQVPEDLLWPLVAELIDSLSEELNEPPDDSSTKNVQRLRKALQAYGRDLDDEGQLAGSMMPALIEDSGLADITVLRQHLNRLRRAAAADDPEAVVGVAKEAIESTAKIVLQTVHGEYDDKAELPALTKQAQKALLLHGSDHQGVNSRIDQLTKQVLGGLGSVATGVAQFRNTAGTGHGRETPVAALSRRHAKPVAGAAHVYCEMLIDTLNDPDAPWRQSRDPGQDPPA